MAKTSTNYSAGTRSWRLFRHSNVEKENQSIKVTLNLQPAIEHNEKLLQTLSSWREKVSVLKFRHRIA
jgi:hypothetical protein